ncbi:hypothetical protein PsorP6_009277 [Peronosclerospora sorghi]|uniref:Uncharacterized protein n=1 Tax=Peronosclerospora sorghi TaxID=230839 RepID=A0ACC0W0L6_9STRA|nr:hypothetical protein PsorP6_009277 [Peronosclerospora sorghi]
MQIELFHTSHAHTVFFYRPCLYLGTILGASISGYCRDRLGRAGKLELAALPFMLGSVLVGLDYGEVTDGRVAEQETNAIIHAQVLAKATARRHHGAFFRPALLCIGLVTLRAVSGFLLELMITSTLRHRLDRSFHVTIFRVAVEGSEDDALSVTLTVAGAAATGIVACYYRVDTRGRLVALQCGAYAVAISNGTGDTDAFLCDSGWAAILFVNAGHQMGLESCP